MKLDTQHSGETKFNSNSRRRKKDSVTSKTSAIRKASSFQFCPPPLAAALPSPALASPPIVTVQWLCDVLLYIYASYKAHISLLGRFLDVDGQFIRQLRKSGVAGRKWASNRKRNEPARWFGVEIYRICHFLSPLSAFLPFSGKL